MSKYLYISLNNIKFLRFLISNQEDKIYKSVDFKIGLDLLINKFIYTISKVKNLVLIFVEKLNYKNKYNNIFIYNGKKIAINNKYEYIKYNKNFKKTSDSITYNANDIIIESTNNDELIYENYFNKDSKNFTEIKIRNSTLLINKEINSSLLINKISIDLNIINIFNNTKSKLNYMNTNSIISDSINSINLSHFNYIALNSDNSINSVNKQAFSYFKIYLPLNNINFPYIEEYFTLLDIYNNYIKRNDKNYKYDLDIFNNLDYNLFFNRCYNIKWKNNTDLTLRMRHILFNKRILCFNNCSYVGIDNNMNILCNCFQDNNNNYNIHNFMYYSIMINRNQTNKELEDYSINNFGFNVTNHLIKDLTHSLLYNKNLFLCITNLLDSSIIKFNYFIWIYFLIFLLSIFFIMLSKVKNKNNVYEVYESIFIIKINKYFDSRIDTECSDKDNIAKEYNKCINKVHCKKSVKFKKSKKIKLSKNVNYTTKDVVYKNKLNSIIDINTLKKNRSQKYHNNKLDINKINKSLEHNKLDTKNTEIKLSQTDKNKPIKSNNNLLYNKNTYSNNLTLYKDDIKLDLKNSNISYCYNHSKLPNVKPSKNILSNNTNFNKLNSMLNNKVNIETPKSFKNYDLTDCNNNLVVESMRYNNVLTASSKLAILDVFNNKSSNNENKLVTIKENNNNYSYSNKNSSLDESYNNIKYCLNSNIDLDNKINSEIKYNNISSSNIENFKENKNNCDNEKRSIDIVNTILSTQEENNTIEDKYKESEVILNNKNTYSSMLNTNNNNVYSNNSNFKKNNNTTYNILKKSDSNIGYINLGTYIMLPLNKKLSIDKRSFKYFFLNIIKEKHIYLCLFLTTNFFKSFEIKYINLVFKIIVIIFISTFLFSEYHIEKEYIYKIYSNENYNNILYIINHNKTRIFASIFTSDFLLFILSYILHLKKNDMIKICKLIEDNNREKLTYLL